MPSMPPTLGSTSQSRRQCVPLLITGDDTGVASSISVVDEDGDGTADNSAADTDATGLSQLAFNTSRRPNQRRQRMRHLH